MYVPAETRFESRPASRMAAGLLALGVHLLFAVLLVFGVSWQTQKPEPVMVDVWAALPPAVVPAAKPTPAPPAPPAPRAEPRVEEPPAPAKPDIALEKKREADELRRMLAEEEARVRAEAEKEKRAAQQKQQMLQQQREEEALARRMADEEVAAAQAQAAKASAARAAAAQRQTELSRLVGQYQDLISAKVRGNTRLPENLQGNPEVRCLVRLLPTGEVVSVRIVKSSGNAAYDDAVARAIERSSPLPLPPDRDARAAFVPELSFIHRPKE